MMLPLNLKNTLGLRQHDCETMTELRVEIDTLDQKIVELLTLRRSYMEQAARIKQDRDTVRDEARVKDVINKVSDHAAKVGGNPDLVSSLYEIMIEWSINYEFDQFDKLKPDQRGRVD